MGEPAPKDFLPYFRINFLRHFTIAVGAGLPISLIAKDNNERLLLSASARDCGTQKARAQDITYPTKGIKMSCLLSVCVRTRNDVLLCHY
jgi:hypothetical protein